MGLIDDIQTLETRYEAGQPVGRDLCRALARMVVRKTSKGLCRYWLEELLRVAEAEGIYAEFVSAAGGVDPARLGVWDAQRAVEAWLERAPGKEATDA